MNHRWAIRRDKEITSGTKKPPRNCVGGECSGQETHGEPGEEWSRLPKLVGPQKKRKKKSLHLVKTLCPIPGNGLAQKGL